MLFSEAASSAALPPLRLVRFVRRNVPQRMQVILSGVKTQQGINGKASYKNRRAWIFCSTSTSCPLPQLKLKCIEAGAAGSTVWELMVALKMIQATARRGGESASTPDNGLSWCVPICLWSVGTWAAGEWSWDTGCLPGCSSSWIYCKTTLDGGCRNWWHIIESQNH